VLDAPRSRQLDDGSVRKKPILVVNNDPAILERLRQLFERYGQPAGF